VARATARPVCEALAAAMRAHGGPEAILTDNGSSGAFSVVNIARASFDTAA
jgi:hypothetical protein